MILPQSQQNANAKNPPVPRPLLRHVEERRRSALFNVFLKAVREGEATPKGVVQCVLAELRAHLRESVRQGVDTDVKSLQHVIMTVQRNPSEALALAQEAIGWEHLHSDERAQLKAARSAGYRQQWMATQPPSEKQLAFLKALGHRGPIESKQHASELIEVLKGGAAHG